MAIGLPLPPTYVPRLAHSWRHAGTVFARQTLIVKAGMLRVVSVTRVLWKRLVNTTQDLFNLRARTRQRHRAQLSVFEHQYDGLVDLLCTSAHEGVRPDREKAYAQARTWMCAHYPCIARYVRRHWALGCSEGQDPFMALYSQPLLEGVINVDIGIEVIMQSRMALEAYRAELDASPI
jgi:hypothetical protein